MSVGKFLSLEIKETEQNIRLEINWYGDGNNVLIRDSFV